ncbi:RagB/SusD family nutrient uptake outer membrane protein [Portibacter lacus]|nr:RagB/SusD family nutrient uptake outer membrane protein [Portibacter lacus]
MKNIKSIIILFILGFSIAGCDKFLEEDFRSGITTDNFFNNDGEAQLAVNGLYNLLHSTNTYTTRGLDNFYQNGTDENGPSRNVNGTIFNYYVAEGVADGNGTWSVLYSLARNSSLFLNSIDGNDKISDGVQKQAVGEILFLRSLAYYHLTNIWGDVPYFRELLSVEELSVIGRTDQNLIKSDMKTDLERAYSLLPVSYSGSDLGRPTKWAAAMLKAKFHILDEEWAQTKAACDDVINNSPHVLLDHYADVFDQSDPANQYNDEHIWAVDFTSNAVNGNFQSKRTDDYNPRIRDEPANRNARPGGDGTPSNLELFQALLKEQNEDMTGYGWSVPLPEIARQENWEDGDMRYDATIVTEHLGFQLTHPYFRKNWNLDQEHSLRGNHPENYIVFRLADTYLMAAEAENNLNGPEGAYSYVNAVRARAFEPDKPWSGMSKDQFNIALRNERKYELSAEGHRKMDLIRWGILVETIQTTEQRAWNNPASNIKPHHIHWPIPLAEIELNPNLLDSDPTNNGYR